MNITLCSHLVPALETDWIKDIRKIIKDYTTYRALSVVNLTFRKRGAAFL